jgi:surfeit locus 1 family protein
VLIDRGFVPMGRDRSVLPDVPPPAGDVRIEGIVELPQAPLPFGSTVPDGIRWPRLDPARHASTTGRDVLPMYVAATGGDVGAGLARDWPAPDLGIEKHLSYMVQWYLFATLAAGLWLGFTWRRLRATH